MEKTQAWKIFYHALEGFSSLANINNYRTRFFFILINKHKISEVSSYTVSSQCVLETKAFFFFYLMAHNDINVLLFLSGTRMKVRKTGIPQGKDFSHVPETQPCLCLGTRRQDPRVILTKSPQIRKFPFPAPPTSSPSTVLLSRTPVPPPPGFFLGIAYFSDVPVSMAPLKILMG